MAKLKAALPADSPLADTELALIDSWWKACNYLSVGMIYLQDNPLLAEPLKPAAFQKGRFACSMNRTPS